MYTDFSVINFRGFQDVILNNLARVNLIAGKNNVGKTSFLETLLLHAGIFDPEILFRTYQSSSKRRSVAAYFRARYNWNVLFSEFDISKSISISGNYHLTAGQAELPLFADLPITVEIRLVNANDYPEIYSELVRRYLRDPRLRGYEDVDTSPDSAELLQFLYQNKQYYMLQVEGRIIRDKVPPPRFPIIFLPSRENIVLEDNAMRFSELKRNRRDDLLLSALQVIEPRISELELYYDGEFPTINGEIGLAEPVPLIAMGEGMNRIASLVLAIGSTSGGVVVIDEIENGLHYSVMRDVWKAIHKAAVEFDVQIFATTHSLECIKAAHEAFSGDSYDFLFHRFDRKKSGEIQAVTFTQKELEIAKAADLEVR